MASLALVQRRGGALDVPAPQNPTECEDYLITWSGGTPPYTLTIVSPRAPPDNVFPDLTDTSLEWTIAIPAGSQLAFKVVEATGSLIVTSAVTVRKGADESCLSESTGSGSPSDPSTSSSPPPETPSSSPHPSPSPTPSDVSPTISTSADAPSPTSRSPDPTPSSSHQTSSSVDTRSTATGDTDQSSGSGSLPTVSASSLHPPGSPTDSTVPPVSGRTGDTPATSGAANTSSPPLSVSGSMTLLTSPGATKTAAPSPGPGKRSLSVGIIVAIIILAIALTVALIIILVRRHRRRRIGAALRPHAFTWRKRPASLGASHAEERSPDTNLPLGIGRRDSKDARLSTATAFSSIHAPTAISSVDAEPGTNINTDHTPILTEPAELVAATGDPSPLSDPRADHALHAAPRNAIQELVVLGAPDVSSPPKLPIDDTDLKQPEDPPPGPLVRPAQRERARVPMERRQLWEEDGGIRLAGGPPDEPPQEILPPPYRRYE